MKFSVCHPISGNPLTGDTRPPPAKKSKGNPVITRYAPPPGYVPGQPGPWQQHYGFSQPSYPSYPQPPFNSTQPYPQTPWPGPHQQISPAMNYSQSHSSLSPLGASDYSAAALAWQTPASASAPQSALAYEPRPMSFHGTKRRHRSAPYSQGHSWTTGGVLDGNGDPMPPRDLMDSQPEELESDFDAECYFARYPDEIDQALSIGFIEWHPALPTKTPLPSTFKEADLDAIAERKPKTLDDDCISIYFTKEKRDECFLSVRQTALWEEVKEDPIFREFPVVPSQIITMSELLEMYRDRPDPVWAAGTPDASREATPDEMCQSQDDVEIDHHSWGKHSTDRNDRVCSNERACSVASEQLNGYRHGSHSRSHSRTASVSSTAGERITRPVPLPPVRDQNQEDLLAALGVTGSPKLVYQTPGPALGAPPQRHSTSRTSSRQNSITSNQSFGHLRLPPSASSMQQRTPPYDGWKSPEVSYGCSTERPTSANSQQRPASGPDGVFDKNYDNDNDATPRAKYQGGDSRKRSHGEFEDDNEAEDKTPQPQRYKLSRALSPYGRR